MKKIKILFILLFLTIFSFSQQIINVKEVSFKEISGNEYLLSFVVKNVSGLRINNIIIEIEGDTSVFKFYKKLKIVKIYNNKYERIKIPVKLKTDTLYFSGKQNFTIKTYYNTSLLSVNKINFYLKSTKKIIYPLKETSQIILNQYVNNVFSTDSSLKEKYIILRNKNLTEIPNEILSNNNLVYLDLSDNKIGKIPDEIPQLKKLRVLILNNNYITHIPYSIVKLENLKVFSINKNPINTSTKLLSTAKNIEYWYINDLLYYSTEILNFLFELKDFKEIVFYNKITKKEEVLHPLSKEEYKKIYPLYDKPDYKSAIQLGNYFQKNNKLFFAELMYEKASTRYIDGYENILKSAKFIDQKGFPKIADIFYKRTVDDKSVKTYQIRMIIADDLTKNKRKDIAKEHYTEVINDKRLTDTKEIYNIAKIFEQQELWDYAVAMYKKIYSISENVGTAKEMHAKIAILNIYEEHPEYQKNIPRFFIAKSVSDLEPNDDIAKKLIIEACKKTAKFIDNEIAGLKDEYDIYIKKAEKAAKKKKRSGTISVLGGVVSSLSSFVPGGELVQLSVDAAGQLTQMGADYATSIRNANLQQNKYESMRVDTKMTLLKKEKFNLADKIDRLLNTNFNNDKKETFSNTTVTEEDDDENKYPSDNKDKIEKLQAEIERLKKIDELQAEIDSLKGKTNEKSSKEIVVKEKTQIIPKRKENNNNFKTIPYKKAAIYYSTTSMGDFIAYSKDFGARTSVSFSYDKKITKQICKDGVIYNIDLIKKTITIQNIPTLENSDKNNISTYRYGNVCPCKMPASLKIRYNYKELEDKNVGGKTWKGYEMSGVLNKTSNFFTQIYFLDKTVMSLIDKLSYRKNDKVYYTGKINVTKIDLDSEIPNEYFDIPKGYQIIDKRQ